MRVTMPAVVVCSGGEESAESTLLILERLRTIYASFDDTSCPSQMFCQLGDVVADTSDPDRAIQ